MPFYFDPLYLILTLPALIFSAWAQYKVTSTFKRFSQMGVRSGMSGAEAAAAVMRAGGVTGIGFRAAEADPSANSAHLFDSCC